MLKNGSGMVYDQALDQLAQGHDELGRPADPDDCADDFQFKLEGQLIRRHPEFHMEDRVLLERIDSRGSRLMP